MNTRRRERGQAASLLLCFLLSLGMLLGPAHIAQAQEGTTGTVSGELTDASGGVLPGVSVVFTNQVNQRVHTVQTDGTGAYRIELPPGAYAVRFELSGFARQETPRLEVQLGRTYDLDASLKVGNITEAVQVTAENAPLVDTRSTIIAHNVTAEEIDRLPKGRSFQSIALTAPSVNSGEIEGGFQVNGASGAENAFTVDGVVTNSLINGASRQNTVFEYIQEVQVKTTGIPAEYGGALGGVISAVTKSGGNIFTGEAHYYLDGSPLSAGPVKRLVLSPVDDKTVQYCAGRGSSRTSVRSSADRSAAPSSATNCFSSDRSRRASTCATRLQLLERHRARQHRAHDQVRPGVRQGQRRQPACQRIRVVARHADLRQGHARRPTTASVANFTCRFEGVTGPEQGARLGADAGERQRQRRRRHLERRLCDVPCRLFPRPVHRHRHSADDELPIHHAHVSLRGLPAIPPNLQGSANVRRTRRARRLPTSTRRSGRCSTPTTTTRSRAAAGTR